MLLAGAMSIALHAAAGASPPPDDRYNLRPVIGDAARLSRFYRFMDPTGLVVGGRVAPNWLLDGASFWYADGAPENTAILRVDGASGRQAPLLDVGRTRAALAALLGRDPPYKGLPFDSIVELGGDRYRFTFEGTDYVLSTDTYSIAPVGGSKDARATPRSYLHPTWIMGSTLVAETPSPDRRWFASLKDGNIVLRAAADDRTVPLTTDGTPQFGWDIEAPRTRIGGGMVIGQSLTDPWSPDGNRLFAVKADRRAVPDLPVIRFLKPEEELTTNKYQRAGAPLDIAHPYAIDVLAKRARPFQLGDTEDHYFTLIGWRPDGSEVLFTRHTRDFKTVDVLAGDPATGAVRTLLSESAKTFVAIQHDVIFGGDNHATILPDGSGLIWRSSRTGWNHFYLYSIDGRPVRALTKGEFPVVDVVSVDQPGGWVYFTAHPDQDRPYDTHLCRVKLTGGELQRLTRLDGQNFVAVSPAKKTFVAVNSRPDRPFRTDFYASDGKQLATVQQADLSALQALGYVAAEEFTVIAADGKTPLWGVMYKPIDFDPGRKYPLIDHLYGGPQVAWVTRHFGLGEDSQKRLDRALAQLGYIVISVDARGTPERSKAFHDVVYGNWGRNEIPDHVATIRQLGKRHAFIDLERVGVWGHSWGGYFTVRALAQAPDVYRVGVASAPGLNPYDMIIYEPYLDLPIRAKAAYDYANNNNWADKIRGKLMLVGGTADSPRPGILMRMVHNLIEAGVDHELVVLPEAGHGYSGKDDDYFIHKLVAHFETYLKPSSAAN